MLLFAFCGSVPAAAQPAVGVPPPLGSELEIGPGAQPQADLYALAREPRRPLRLVTRDGSTAGARGRIAPPPEGPPCFDAAAAIAERHVYWVRLHVHAYLDDTCGGDFLAWNPDRFPQAELYPRVQTLIDQANGVLADLSIPWVDEAVFGIAQASEPAHLPVRFYLDGVTVHCDGDAQRLGARPAALRDRYLVPGMLNAHLAEWVGKSQGEAEGLGGALSTFTVELLSPTNFIHEAMHLMGLPHPFHEDGIADTPIKRFRFDYNRDGDTDDYFRTTDKNCPAVGAEAQLRGCYMIKEDADGGPHYIDYDGDCVNDYTFEEVGHPCASWTYQSNNIMDYTGYNTIYNAPALTHGQVAVVTTNVATHRCHQLVDSVPDTAPLNLKAYVPIDGEPPGDDTGAAARDGVPTAVFTGLSQNVARYRFSVRDARGRRVYRQWRWRRDTLPDRLILPDEVLAKAARRERPYTLHLEARGAGRQRACIELPLEAPRPGRRAGEPGVGRATRE